MSRVWIVSGIVLVGTGLSLALFGGWLAGNSNCDAGDLGRQCIAASLGVSVIGAALAGGGLLRLRRLGEEGEETGEGGAGLLGARPGITAIVFAVVGLVLLAALLPVPQLPANVYAKAAPALDAVPSDLLPAALSGHSRAALVSTDLNGSVEAVADYDGGITVVITRFNATTNLSQVDQNNTTVEVAVDRASGLLDLHFTQLDTSKGPRACVRAGSSHWFTQDGPEKWVLAWRSGTFVFEVRAPTPTLRNQAAAALTAA